MKINLRHTLTESFNAGVLAAIFLPLALGIPQCASQTDYDAWDREAWSVWADNVNKNYKWEYDQVREVFEAIGEQMP